jgi:hypothetical protein
VEPLGVGLELFVLRPLPVLEKRTVHFPLLALVAGAASRLNRLARLLVDPRSGSPHKDKDIAQRARVTLRAFGDGLGKIVALGLQGSGQLVPRMREWFHRNIPWEAQVVEVLL